MEKQVNLSVNLSIDMDGVLAKFNENLQAEELLFEKGYFLNLEPQRNVVRALYNVCFLDWDEDISIRPRILSAFLTESKYALDEKKAWLKREVPALSKNYIFCECGQSKSNFIKSTELANRDILIDDYGANCKSWMEAGGVYIKVWSIYCPACGRGGMQVFSSPYYAVKDWNEMQKHLQELKEGDSLFE